MIQRGSKAGAAAIIGLCIIVCTFDLLSLKSPSSQDAGLPQLRRSLRWSDHHNRPPMNPLVRDHMKPLTTEPDPTRETVLFWHIAKSGGTTLKTIYKCMNQTLTVRVGADPKWGHDEDEELTVFEPGNTGALFVNVDTVSSKGILRAEEMGLVPSGLADLIVTPNLNFAIEHLYDKNHKGRVLALFRHPVERLISKFYYTQVATWERSYRPDLVDMDLLYWAENINTERNHIVKSLVGLGPDAPVYEADLAVAVRTVKQRFIVGLMNEMEDSIHRFNIFMGIDESKEPNRECMDEFFGHGVKKSNSNPSKPKVDERDPAWQVIAEHNDFDVRLYIEVVHLFDEQRELIKEYARSLVVSNGLLSHF